MAVKSAADFLLWRPSGLRLWWGIGRNRPVYRRFRGFRALSGSRRAAFQHYQAAHVVGEVLHPDFHGRPIFPEAMPMVRTNFPPMELCWHPKHVSYCQIWCLRVVGHAAIWLGLVVSIPFLKVTPVMTLVR